MYEDLGNAVRKINIDLGIPIVFTGGGPCEGRHCITARIRYSAADGANVEDGLLIYIKPSLTGEKPADVRQYAAANPEFPHQSTSDQLRSRNLRATADSACTQLKAYAWIRSRSRFRILAATVPNSINRLCHCSGNRCGAQ